MNAHIMALNLLIQHADSLFAVRTFSAVEVFNVKQFESSFRATSIANLTHKVTNGEDIVDIAYAVEAPAVLIVSDKGTVFRCDINSGGKTRQVDNFIRLSS